MKTQILIVYLGIFSCCYGDLVSLTDTKGRSISVEILSVSNDKVNVKKADGSKFSIPLSSLQNDSREAATKAAAKAAAPQAGGVPGRVNLSAVSNAIGKVTDTSWETSWGSYDKDIYRSRGVVLTVEAAQAGDAILEIHWLGTDLSRGGSKGVVVFDKKEITLKERAPQSHEFAALFVENDANYAALDVRDRSGLKYSGWVARVISKNGEQLAIIAARPPLITQIGKPDPEQKPFPDDP